MEGGLEYASCKDSSRSTEQNALNGPRLFAPPIAQVNSSVTEPVETCRAFQFHIPDAAIADRWSADICGLSGSVADAWDRVLDRRAVDRVWLVQLPPCNR